MGGNKVLRYPIVIEKANGNYSAYCPDLPGCVATGPTVKETLLQMRDAIQFHIRGLEKEKADNAYHQKQKLQAIGESHGEKTSQNRVKKDDTGSDEQAVQVGSPEE